MSTTPPISYTNAAGTIRLQMTPATKTAKARVRSVTLLSPLSASQHPMVPSAWLCTVLATNPTALEDMDTSEVEPLVAHLLNYAEKTTRSITRRGITAMCVNSEIDNALGSIVEAAIVAHISK